MDISGKCKTVEWFAKYQKHPSLGCYDGTIWRIIRIGDLDDRENHMPDIATWSVISSYFSALSLVHK